MNRILFVSFYTPDYREPAANLRKSLEDLGLEHDIREIEALGTWKLNVIRKPAFLYSMLEEHQGYDGLVWVDADGIVVARPDYFFETDCDLSVRWFGGEPLAGTVYCRNEPHVREFVKQWARDVESKPVATRRLIQVSLKELLRDTSLKTDELPTGYCVLCRDGSAVLDPKILHFRWQRGDSYPKTLPRKTC